MVYTQAMGRDDLTTDEAEADAGALMDEWGVGQAGVDDGLVILFDLDTTLEHGQVQLYAGAGFDVERTSTRRATGDLRRRDGAAAPGRRHRRRDPRRRSARSSRRPVERRRSTRDGRPPPRPSRRPARRSPTPRRTGRSTTSPGIFSPDAIVKAESVIDGIEARTGAEVVVYSQLTGLRRRHRRRPRRAPAPSSTSGASGRPGFDDGMVIFFDIDPSLEHGQVQLYAGPGFEAAFLSNSERQSIFENDMVPLLRSGDFDGALEAALTKVDAAATPEHAAAARARPPDQRRPRAGRGADPVPGPRRLGVLPLAAVRQGPGLPRRPVDPRCRPRRPT